MHRLAARTAVLLALIVGAQVWLVAQQAKSPKTDPGAATAVINLNTATAEQLDSLPGVGAALAARIVEYRQKNGSFKKVEDLMNVKGIGEKAFLKMKNRLTVGPAKPAGPNGQ